jgi:hypothetical protein
MANGHKFPRGFLKQQLREQSTTFYEARCAIVNSQRQFQPHVLSVLHKQPIRFPGCYSRNETLYGGGKHCSLTMKGINLASVQARTAAVDALHKFYKSYGWTTVLGHNMLLAFRDPLHRNVIAVVYPFPRRDTGIEISHRMYETPEDADVAIAAGLNNGFIDECEAMAGSIVGHI